ncbi:HAD-IA family hydrolase [Actinophytocola sp.]|uniref:HAD family hydrolase n=1 Tax=Actinophytocola sp. TaxID=1872138 RepID=UPI002ED2EAB2
MRQALLCDLDGVLRRWPPMTGIEQAYGVPPGALAAAAFAPDRLLPAVTGRCTDEEWRAAVAADLATHTDQATELVAAWSASVGEVDQEVAELLARARRHGPVVLVTNATTRLESDVDILGLADLVDAIVNSARLAAAKPDRRIYLEAAERAGVTPERCLFVDDSATNTDTARALGMTAHHFTGTPGLRAFLVSQGWEPRAASRRGPGGTPPRGRRPGGTP